MVINCGQTATLLSLGYSLCAMPIMLWYVNPVEVNHQLESRVRENRTHGSEGGEALAFPTPILMLPLCWEKTLLDALQNCTRSRPAPG